MHYVESIFFQWNLTIANMKPGHLTNVDSSQVPQQNCKLHVTSEGHSERNTQSRNLICTISGDQQNWLASVHVKCHYRILTNFFFKNYDVSFLCDHVICTFKNTKKVKLIHVLLTVKVQTSIKCQLARSPSAPLLLVSKLYLPQCLWSVIIGYWPIFFFKNYDISFLCDHVICTFKNTKKVKFNNLSIPLK